jgi:flagellar basal-body rod protein FlgB
MSAWIDQLFASPAGDALSLAARFAEQRQRVLAANIANLETPDYHSRRLDEKPFQQSLQRALAEQQTKPAGALKLRGNAQFSTLSDGRVRSRPAVTPAANVLFHDGTNARLEQLVGDASKNALYYQMATNLLSGRYQGTLAAIRGRNT